jgi:hypothetical protein
MIGTYTENVTFGDGASTIFDYDWRVDNAAEIGVAIIDSLTGIVSYLAPDEYSVSGIGVDNGGTVTLLNYVPLGTDKVVRFSQKGYNQGTRLYNQGGMFPEAVEEGLDNLARLAQQLEAVSQRAIRGPAGDGWPELPGPAGRAGKVLFFNSLGIPNLAAQIANIALAATTAITHTPSQPNTYVHTLYEDLEWDRLTTLRFLSPAMRANPTGVDCWEGLQNMADFISNDNGGTIYAPYKTMRLGGKAYALSRTLEVTGYQSGGGVRRGRIMLSYGELFAVGARPSQLSNPIPLIKFSDNAQACGMEHVYVDCQGLCSGVLVELAGGTSKIELVKNRIVNFCNPERPLQSNLYNNLVNIAATGPAKMASRAPARRYETSSAHPYGIRLGPEDTSDNTATTMTGSLDGNHVTQWEVGHPNFNSHTKRTGIAYWLCATDCYFSGKFNSGSDCLKSMVIEGHANKILAYHCSPTGKTAEYAVNDAPTADTISIGTEHRGNGMNEFIGCYHERALWLEDPRVMCIGVTFSRNDDSGDGNVGAIYLDAIAVDQVMDGDNQPIIRHCKRSSDLEQMYVYREDGGFNWLNKPILTGLEDDEVNLNSSTTTWITADKGQTLGHRFYGTALDRHLIGFKARNSTREARFGINNDLLHGRLDNITVWEGNENVFDIKGKVSQAGVQIAPARRILAADVPATTTTFADVFTLVGLNAGHTYGFRAVLHVTADATGGHKYQAINKNSLAATIVYEIISVKNTDGSQPITARKTAFASSAGEASGTGYRTLIEGSITPSVSGDFNIQFAQNTASGTSSVLAGSTLEVWGIT